MKARNKGRRPDYTLSAMMKINRDAKGRVGAAWTQDDGSIQIKLDPFVILQGEANGGEGMFLTLYKSRDTAPNEDGPSESEASLPPKAAPRSVAPGGHFDDLEDDIPF